MSMSKVPAPTELICAAVQKEIQYWLAKYPPDKKRSALLPALRLVQEQNKGWLSVELMDAVADYLELPKIAVYEVVSFYSMYERHPIGRHKLSVCNSISCMLNGSGKILHHLEKTLGIGVNETTSDGLFTLKEVECLAACVAAPVLQLDDRAYHEKLTIATVDTLIDELRKAELENAE